MSRPADGAAARAPQRAAGGGGTTHAVDVVVVSYHSRDRLGPCVAPLAGRRGVRVIVADNASADGSLEAVAHLPVTALALPMNGGFSYGCNAGWRAGAAPYVLFLNPDARIAADSIQAMISALERDPRLGAVGPRILGEDGQLEFSQRRFPRLRSTFAVALLLHRLWPRASWSDEVIKDSAVYDAPASPDWVSGACILVRRSDLERLEGLDEGFFLYCEDTDLCRRLRDLGRDVRYEPSATCAHAGGASAPRPSLLSIHAASRIRYARRHGGRLAALGERLGISLGAIVRWPVVSGPSRAAQAGVLRVALWGPAEPPGGAAATSPGPSPYDPAP